jgi:DNA repair protein RecO (recombination protein O)
MPTIRDQAVCIRHWDYSESSQTVSLFCRDHGTIRGLAKGARREQGRFSGGIDLLARGELVALVKPDRDLATITDWDLQEVFWSLRSSLAANRSGYYMADLVQQFFPHAAPHPAVFDALCEGLRALSESTAELTTLTFQWVVLTEAGYQPRLAPAGGAADGPTLGFSAAEGGVVEEHLVSPAWRVRSQTVDLLRAVAAGAPTAGQADAATIRRANRLLAAYVREVLHREPPTLGLVFPDLDRPAHSRS